MSADAPNGRDQSADRELPKLSAEREKELSDRLGRLHTAVPISKMIAELKEQAKQLQNPQP